MKKSNVTVSKILSEISKIKINSIMDHTKNGKRLNGNTSIYDYIETLTIEEVSAVSDFFISEERFMEFWEPYKKHFSDYLSSNRDKKIDQILNG